MLLLIAVEPWATFWQSLNFNRVNKYVDFDYAGFASANEQ